MRLVWKSPFGVKRFEGEPAEVWEHVRAALFWNKVDETLMDIAAIVF